MVPVRSFLRARNEELCIMRSALQTQIFIVSRSIPLHLHLVRRGNSVLGLDASVRLGGPRATTRCSPFDRVHVPLAALLVSPLDLRRAGSDLTLLLSINLSVPLG